MARDTELDALVAEFSQKIMALADDRARKHVQAMLAPLTQGAPMMIMNGARTRAPQLCPVPGCNNTAAPRYGMVCTAHKDLPKNEIKKYREARKASLRGDSGAPAPAARRNGAKRQAVPVS